MNVRILSPGHKIRLTDGSEAMVIEVYPDLESAKVRMLPTGDTQVPAGSEVVVDGERIDSLLGVAMTKDWGDGGVDVAIVPSVHVLGEPRSFDATTMKGVPFGATITCNAPSSSGALEEIVSSLRAFGFTGRVTVHDSSGSGMTVRYVVDELDE